MQRPMELHALVLAAGAGTRFGGRKLLAPWGTGVLLHGALRSAFSAPVASVAVVTGADAEAISAAVRDFAREDAAKVDLRIVHAADYGTGVSASLRAGLTALPSSAEGVFVFLGDMPCIPAAVPPALADALAPPDILAAAPVHEGRRGHPVLVAKALIPQFLMLRGDEGAKRIIGGLGPALALVPTADPGVLLDVDETADLARLGPGL
jgi:molybdenum cofactor cytidylyltransferase